MGYQQKTKRGYDFYEVASSLQKAVRRADARLAGYFALELFHSGYWQYVWKRLIVIAAEDCHGIISQEIQALYEGFKLCFPGPDKKTGEFKKGRVFISKAVLVLCAHPKSRDADHLSNLVYDLKRSVSDEDVEWYLQQQPEEGETLGIPDYALDAHTRRGKAMGKTKKEFFQVEHDALEPRAPGLFDGLVGDGG